LHETEQDIKDFKELVRLSGRQAGPHVKAALQIPEKSLQAEQLLRYLQGLHTFSFATSTTSGQPQITLTKALFYRGKFYIPTVRNAIRTRHVMHQPGVSLSAVRDDDFALIINGQADILDPENEEHQEEFRFVEEVHRTYSNETPGDWKKGIYIRVKPVHFYSYASDPSEYPGYAERRPVRTREGSTTI
jgi:uncharacterized pyridoxamine 5'-phosphate oxidase family protein